MMETNQILTDHYTQGTLAEVIDRGLEQLRNGADTSDVELLAAVDEFHIGGRPATRDVAAGLDLHPSHRVLDIGCGLGGTARLLATEYGCEVAGFDLTPEYVEVGNQLNANLGLSDRVRLKVADAVDIPEPDASYDRATMLHVGMNIPDKSALFREITRLVKPGGLLAVYDVMRIKDDGVDAAT